MSDDWYPMEYERWDDGTDGLTLEQEGAYLRICHHIYRRRGPIPGLPNTLARVLRVHPNKAASLLKQLIDLGKVSVGSDGRVSNTKAIRVVGEREAKRTQRIGAGRVGGTRSGEIRSKSLEKQDANEAVASSPSKQNEAEERRGEESTGEEKASGAQGALAIEGKPEKKKRQPRVGLTTIDSEWRMGEDQIEYSKRIGLTGVEAGREWKKFKGHHQAKGTKFVDWNAAWQNWARRSLEFMGRAPRDEPPAPKVGTVQRDRSEWEKIVRVYKGTNNWVRDWGPPPGEPGCLVPADLIGERLL